MWQHWYEHHGPVDFLAVAADAQGPKAAEPWVELARATFAVAVDSENKLGALLGYTVVPTGVFVDEKGVVRHLQAGDFSVNDEQTVARVERFLDGDHDVLAGLNVESSSRLKPLEQELVDAKVSLASELLVRGRREEALEALDRALELDPENYVIRKQRWTIRNPERFQPEIDWDWQREQLVREREAERQARETACSPDGCPIPK